MSLLKNWDRSTQLLRLNKVSLKGRGKISVVEHSRYHNITRPTLFQAKPRSDVKCIVSFVEDASFENPA